MGIGKDGYKNTHTRVLNNTYQRYRCGKSEFVIAFWALHACAYINKRSLQANHLIFVSNIYLFQMSA